MRNLNDVEQQQVSGAMASAPEQTGWVTDSALFELQRNAGISVSGLFALGFFSIERVVLPRTLTGAGVSFSSQRPYEC